MNTSKLIAFCLFLSTSLVAQDLVILHTNDLHSRLNGFSPESEYTPLSINDDPTIGGFSRIASVIRNEHNTYGEKVLTVDAGDFLMGTLFHNLEPTTGFQLSLMKKMGYDVVALGNHEFDFGPETLSEIIGKSLKNGPIPALTLSNIHFSQTSEKDNSLEHFYQNGTLSRHRIIEKNGIKIGIFSLLGKDAQQSAGGAYPVTFKNYIRCARKEVKLLKEKNVDFIIALSHSGVEQDNSGNWTGEDVVLAQKVPEINLIISGHSHTNLKEPIVVNGTGIAQVGSFGSTVGKIEVYNIRTNPSCKFTQIEINDGIKGDKDIQLAINAQEERIKKTILTPLGLHYHQEIFETDFPLVLDKANNPEEGNLGPFIADAILNETNLLKGGNTHIALIPAGMIRGNILPGNKGLLTTADLFSMLSLGIGNDSVPGYPLARVFLNGKELKRIMEVLLIAYQSGASRYMYYSGLRATYNPEKFYLRQIQTLEVRNDKGIFETVNLNDDKKLYGLVGNSYLLSFVNMVKKMSMGVIQITPKNIDGTPIDQMYKAVIDFDPESPGIQEGKEWISVIHFSETFSDIDNNGVPNIPITYKEKINPLYTIESLPGRQTIVEK
ncbi:bifunctional metallophosphatase/5'-nucleotidase [Saccharicrinis sp. FJH54]|uniref:bifunctional metallophosphatase/5'-nucleotidase n=1 Tax=Saccharicrinis sp. FJH54 TaxID=3344665 RepID=UPI0035D5169B